MQISRKCLDGNNKLWSTITPPKGSNNSKQWWHRDSSSPKTAMTVPTGGKVQSSIFCDENWFQKGKSSQANAMQSL